MTTELDLIQNAKAGDRRAQETLLKNYERLIHKEVHALFRPPANGVLEREDMIQEARLALLSSLTRFDPEKGTLVTWAGRVIRFRLMDFVKRSTRHCEFTEVWDEAKMEQIPAPLPAGLDSAGVGSRPMICAEAVKRVLDPREQELVRLHIWEGLTLKECSRELNCHERTANNIWKRAKQRIREYTKQAEGGAVCAI